MSFLMRQVAHCDICGHEWITSKVPSHCAKCKSRKWNQGQGVPLEQARRFETNYSASTPVGKPIKVKIPERWKKLEPDERVYDKHGFRHALNCKCLVCKPPK